MAKKVKNEKVFRIRPWMVIVTVFIPIAGIAFMIGDLRGQKKAKAIADRRDSEIEKAIELAKKENTDEVKEKEDEEES